MKKSLLLLLFTIHFLFAEDVSEKFVDIHGFVSQGFMISNNYNYISDESRSGTWEMRQIGINFQKEIKNRFRIGMQFLSRDEGVYGNNKVTLDFAYGSVFIDDKLQVLVGRNKIPLGIYTEVQDYDFLTPFAIMPSAIYEKGLRSVSSVIDGIQLTGNFDFNRGGNLGYTLTFGDINTKNNDDMGYYLETLGLGTTQNTSMDYAFSSGIAYHTPLTGLELSASYLLMKNWIIDKGHITVSNTYLDKQTNINWFYLGAKYIGSYIDLMAEWHRRYMIEDVTLSKHNDSTGEYTQIPTFAVPQEMDTVNRGGWYVGINVKPLEWFNVGGYFQDYRDRYDEINHVTGKPIEKNNPANINRDGALTLTFKVKDILTVKMEGHLVYGTALLSKPMNSNSLNNNGQFSNGDYWQYGIIKVSYNF